MNEARSVYLKCKTCGKGMVFNDILPSRRIVDFPWQRSSTESILAQHESARRRLVARMDPDHVLKACRGVVKELLQINAYHRRHAIDLAKLGEMARSTVESETMFQAVAALESYGFFDVDGALSRCDETQPCRSCKALFAERAARR